jgi:release factor glutamine methyltransferase
VADGTIEHVPVVAKELDVSSVRVSLEAAGCVAADEEADELIGSAQGDGELRQMLARRLTGEPLAWITGRTTFCHLDVTVVPGVYVPRWQSEPLALMAARLLPPTGQAVDLCTGTGAVAMVMRSAHPAARIVGTELDPVAAACARRNGLVVYEGSLDEPLPAELASQVDVMTGVLPYVPTDSLRLLPRDVQRFEPTRALDGGTEGLRFISTVVRRSPRWLRRDGWLLLEAGSDQIPAVAAMMTASGFRHVDAILDAEGDPRGLCGRLHPPAVRPTARSQVG